MLQGWMVKNYCVDYDNKMVMITIMIIIKRKKEDVVFRNKKKKYICKYQHILSGVTNPLHERFFLFCFSSITFITTVDKLCS